MNKWIGFGLCFMAMLLVTACDNDKIQFQLTTDWVDFVMLDETTYTRVPQGTILADPSEISTDSPIGMTTFEVFGNIRNTGYQPKDGDAAYLPAGTAIYGLKSQTDHKVIAVKDPAEVSGFKLYATDHFDFDSFAAQLDLKSVNRIEIYKRYPKRERLRELSGEEIKDCIRLLEQGEKDAAYQPGPNVILTYYDAVFYGNHPYALSRVLADDGSSFIFYEDEIRKIPRSIGQYLK